MTPNPEAVALLAEAIQKWQDPTGREAHDDDCGCVVEARGMLAHPPLAADLRTAELARAWWSNDGSYSALAAHLRATEGGK